MIKAELSYNPYLLETIVRFNGQEPRINSLVEKFQDGSLQKWVHRVPDIFYDEMNGFDFELEFSGTQRDYQEVVDGFRKAEISEDLVRIFHKNVLDGRYKKSALIDELIIWLSENTNRNFDFGEFKADHADLFDSSYVYIIFQGSELSTSSVDDKDISVEHVNSVDELKDTDLSNTPILMYLSRNTINSFQKNLRFFMNREDVEYSQLFFLIHPSLDTGKVERIIKDLGIATPNIVSDIFGEEVKKYIELYPVSEYIYEVVSLFRSITDKLAQQLQHESEQSAIANREVHARIDQYEAIIGRLKDVHHYFLNRDNIEIPSEWANIQGALLDSISNWRKRKTKITDDYEAEFVAGEFENEARRYYKQFLDSIINLASITKQEIDATYEREYKKADFDVDFQVNTDRYEIPVFSDEIMIAADLKKLVSEEYVQPKEDIFGLFFKTSSDTAKEPVLQRTYYYQNWRECVADVVRPKSEDVIRLLFDGIQKYESDITAAYIQHLSENIEEQTELKRQEAEQLSDEERLLQNDIDWLGKIQDQLKIVERG